jgi:cysteinyl-tRNA synthetase
MIQISNALTGTKEPLLSRVAGQVSLYVCGVTVYDDCHLGHARSAVVFDVIRNYLEWRGIAVRYVKNFTDVDDKIIQRATRDGVGWMEIAERYLVAYEADMARLGVRPPTVSPRATEHIGGMLRLIETLIGKGVAYVADGDVYFEVARFPSYGKLSGRTRDVLSAGVSRIEMDERKRDPLDFALWKASKPGEPAWESPWGQGRPGWHIECSAMAMRHLGETLDLHGGGTDLIFPHHENEVAQSEAATGMPFVGCWIHHGFVTVDAEKMSKSLGNFFTVREIFEKSSHFPEPVVAEVVRFYLLSAHYRAALDFSDQSLEIAKNALDPFYTLFQKLAEQNLLPGPEETLPDATLCHPFETAMDDDFNAPRAIAALQFLRSETSRLLSRGEREATQAHAAALRRLGGLLGVFRLDPAAWNHAAWHKEGATSPTLLDERVDALIAERLEARNAKEWGRADTIRRQLAEGGIVIEDRPDGTTRVKR